MKAVLHDLDFIFSNSCNLKCPYCDHTYLYRNKTFTHINFDEIYLSMVTPLIEKTKIVSLSGGEPGILNREFVTNFLEFLDSHNNDFSLYIYTNGLFIDRYIHLLTTFKHKVRIIWHLAPEPSEIHIEKAKTYLKYSFPIIAHVVLHKHNIEYLKHFLIQWKKILPTFPIRVGLFTSNEKFLRERFEVKSEDVLDFSDFCAVHKIDFIFKFSKLLKVQPKMDYCIRKFCFFNRSNLIVDFEEKQFIRCCWMDPQRAISFEEFNDENLRDKFLNDFSYDACKSCNHCLYDLKDPYLLKWLRSCLLNGK